MPGALRGTRQAHVSKVWLVRLGLISPLPPAPTANKGPLDIGSLPPK